MKAFTRLSLLAIPVLALGLVSCKKASQADATKPLQQSFESAAPEVKQAIATVISSLQAKNYAEATKALASVATQHTLTEPQREAVGVYLLQINQAIAANPSLDTKEMYQLRARMFQVVHSGH
jgi:hypothetical protein